MILDRLRICYPAKELVPMELVQAREVKVFPARWKIIISKLEQIASLLSDLSSHPFFSKNALCKEQLQAVSETLNGAIELADSCLKEKFEGKLKMQSDIDALLGKLNMNLRDIRLLIKTSVLDEATLPLSSVCSSSEFGTAAHSHIKEVLAWLQIEHLESKHKAVDILIQVVKVDEKSVLSVMGRSNVTALVRLLAATSPRIREKARTVICSLAESGNCKSWLVSESVLPPLIRLIESDSMFGREKETISLQRLLMTEETTRAIVEHGGILPLLEICHIGDYVSHAKAACTLRNIPTVPKIRQILAKEGIIKGMINLLGYEILLGSKE
ncbi:AP2/ERF domain-containing transcription factor [Hibiscus syriacus]|uniref:AP2/ERF domain-containing transcription factor n=1 Tax=Hibiscus syriacus TaxID=106335 RepID=A0A6A2XUF8_HIBSY|nr:AP2/ERF domain-containing transcription factor [Hibiscus syriacus]